MPRQSSRSARDRSRVGRLFALCLLALLMIGSVPVGRVKATPQQQGAPEINIAILPINTARLLVGQRFDLRIEVSGDLAPNTDPGTFTVTVDGKPLAQFWSKEPAKSNTTPQSGELTVRQVSFDGAGRHTVRAIAGPVAKEVTYEVVQPQSSGRPAKNIIFMLADGMTSEVVTISRIISRGLTEGKFNSLLEIDQMEEYGYVTTSGYDALVTDSANSMAAYMSGQKGVVNGLNVYADNTANTLDDPQVENTAQYLKRTRNMAIGIVTTAELEDATPAAVFAHTRRRADKQVIADQMFEPDRRPEVILGGGAAYFVPKSTPGSKRTDERNLVQEFAGAGYSVAANRAEMNKAGTPEKLLGLFHPDNMNVYVDRQQLKNPEVLGPYMDQPTVPEMTQKAIDVLVNTPTGKRNGFFLMVEGGSVDKMLHPMDWERATGDQIEFDQALGVAKRFAAQHNDTLVIAVADHGHSISVYGTYDTTKGPGNRDAIGLYADSKFPTYADNDRDGFPDSWDPSRKLAVGFGNRPDYREDFMFNSKPTEPTVRDPNASKETYVPNPARDAQGILLTGNLPFNSSNEVHSADDVPLFVLGPGASTFNGINDNTDLFFKMMAALGPAPASPRGQTGTGGIMLSAAFGIVVVYGAGRRLRRLPRAIKAAASGFSAGLRSDT